jgi:hypothetical protein
MFYTYPIDVQDAAEIVKHFKLQLRAFPLGYHWVQVSEQKQGPSDLVDMERWGVRERVYMLWNCLFGRGPLQRDCAYFTLNWINRMPHLQIESLDG